MRPTHRQRILRRLQLRESWVVFFVLGNVMLNFPFLKIFNRSSTILGYPLLYLYFVIGWAISISVIYLFSSSVEQEERDNHQHEQGSQ